MDDDYLIDLRNICEPALSMQINKALKNAKYNSHLHFIANNSFVFRQVKLICFKHGHHWQVLESTHKINYFQIRVGRQQVYKQELLLAALKI